VKDVLHMSPYNRGYSRLIPAVLSAIGVALLIRMLSPTAIPGWLIIGGAICLCYLVLVGVSVAMGLDSDDQLIADAIWGRLRGSFSK
jgi:hypothetical protein